MRRVPRRSEAPPDASKNNNQESKMTKGQVLQDPFLNVLRKEKVPVSIIWLTGSSCRGL
jgi:hypothetical protein